MEMRRQRTLIKPKLVEKKLELSSKMTLEEEKIEIKDAISATSLDISLENVERKEIIPIDIEMKGGSVLDPDLDTKKRGEAEADPIKAKNKKRNVQDPDRMIQGAKMINANAHTPEDRTHQDHDKANDVKSKKFNLIQIEVIKWRNHQGIFINGETIIIIKELIIEISIKKNKKKMELSAFQLEYLHLINYSVVLKQVILLLYIHLKYEIIWSLNLYIYQQIKIQNQHQTRISRSLLIYSNEKHNFGLILVECLWKYNKYVLYLLYINCYDGNFGYLVKSQIIQILLINLDELQTKLINITIINIFSIKLFKFDQY